MSEVMTKKYESKIVEIGEEVAAFTEENMLVIFNDTVPPDLKTIGVIHEKTQLLDQVEVGDILEISGSRYEITSVGHKVNDTLQDIGHCTIAFNGEAEADLPGTMCVEQKPLPDLELDSKISILKPE